MKRVIAALIAGIAVGASGVAGAATMGWSHKQDGIWCKSVSGSIACIPTTARGYGVAISRDAILVMDIQSEKKVFVRYQP
jgi:hypothetical protein